VKEAIERLRRVTAAELAAMHKRLWGTHAAQLAVVGDFDPAQVKADVGKALAGWKAAKPYGRITLPFKDNVAGEDNIDTPDKEMAFLAVGEAVPVRDDDPAYPALYLFNYMLGGSPTSRLFLRLRQKDGISYGAFSQLMAHPIEQTSFLLAGAIAAPANMDKAMSALLSELGDMVNKGVTDKELVEAKQSYAKVWQGRVAEDDFVVTELGQGLFLGRTFAYWDDLNGKIEKLTVADVNAAAKRFIDPGKLSKVEAGDLAKKESTEKRESTKKSDSKGETGSK
jgi:zinc protease